MDLKNCSSNAAPEPTQEQLQNDYPAMWRDHQKNRCGFAYCAFCVRQRGYPTIEDLVKLASWFRQVIPSTSLTPRKKFPRFSEKTLL